MPQNKLPILLSPYYLNSRLKEQHTMLLRTVNESQREIKKRQIEHDMEQTKLLKKIEQLEAQKFEMLCNEFQMKRVIENVEEHNARLAYNLNRYDGIIQELHTDLNEKESLLEKALETFKLLDDKRENRTVCCCCYSLCDKQNQVSCNAKENPHVFCITCVEAQAKSMWDKICVENTGKIPCFSINDCEGTLNLCPGEYCKKWITNFDFHNVSLPMMRKHGFLNEKKLDAKTQNFLRFDGSFLGYKCSNCNFGPLWHDFCSDLQEHHGTLFNNTCPRCHYFHHSTSDMQRWDGSHTVSLTE